MAIRTMTYIARDAAIPAGVEVIHDYWGHETGRVCHRLECPRYRNDDDLRSGTAPECVVSGNCGVFQPLYMVTTHKGLVLSTGERNGYDDSDFYALVWNPETGRPESVEYASTRGWSYPNSATPDAVEDVLTAYKTWQERCRETAQREAAEKEAKAVRKGKRIQVIRGRKVPVGTVGECIWRGQGSYGERVGIKTGTGNVVWTALTNVEVVA